MTLIDDQEEELKNMGLRSKGVLLVGGLGTSSFVKSWIEQSYPAEEKIKVFRGKQSWTSVVMGAVKCELLSLGNIQVVNTRLTRWNYGFRFSERFNADKESHRSSEAFECPFEPGAFRVDQVAWLIRKGDEVRPSIEAQTHEFTRIFKESDFQGGNAIFFLILVRSDERGAPEWPTKGVKDFVELKCVVALSLVRQAAIRSFDGDDPAWKVLITIEMRILPATLAFKCLIEDVSVGVGKVIYRATHAAENPAGARSEAVQGQNSQNGVSGTTSPPRHVALVDVKQVKCGLGKIVVQGHDGQGNGAGAMSDHPASERHHRALSAGQASDFKTTSPSRQSLVRSSVRSSMPSMLVIPTRLKRGKDEVGDISPSRDLDRSSG